MKSPRLKSQQTKSPQRQQSQQKSVSKGKQRSNKKESLTIGISSTHLSKQNVNQPNSKDQSQVKKQLFPIAQFPQNSGSKPSVTFAYSIQPVTLINGQKGDNHQQKNLDQSSPSFQRSSMIRSQKQYNVSLASSNRAKQPSNRHSPSPSLSRSKRPSSRSPSQGQNKQKNKQQFFRMNMQNQQQAQQWLQLELSRVKNESIKKINEEFIKEIEQPLKFQAELSNSPTAQVQRCLHHNTPLSLYCSIDRQLLCVACIYSSKVHKSHRVVPLTKSQKEMKEDIEAFRNRIDSTMQDSQHLIRQASLNLIKIEKQYPNILAKIQTYYSSIHELIQRKKIQQLEYVETMREQYRTEMKVIGQFFDKINNIVFDRLKIISHENKQLERQLTKIQLKISSENQSYTKDLIFQSVIKTRCNYQILARYHKILHKYSDQLFDQKGKFSLKMQNFQQVLGLIKYKLALVIPIMDPAEAGKKGFTNLGGNDGFGFDNIVGEGRKNNDKEVGDKNDRVSPIKDNGQESQIHKKGFSTAPQVPKGISRRFL